MFKQLRYIFLAYLELVLVQFGKIESEQAKQRYETCKGCELRRWILCGDCGGCVLKAKVQCKECKCDKWQS